MVSLSNHEDCRCNVALGLLLAASGIDRSRTAHLSSRHNSQG